MSQQTNVSSFKLLSSILEQVEQMDPSLFPPTRKTLPTDTILPLVIPDHLKKLFAYMCFLGKQKDEIKLGLEYLPEDSDERKLQHQEFHRLQDLYDVCHELLWSEVRLLLGEHDPCERSVGFRQQNNNWVVVSFQPPRSIQDVLGQLFRPE